ncbi:ATP-binding protein [Desulfocurvus sp. DL9XJH121]
MLEETLRIPAEVERLPEARAFVVGRAEALGLPVEQVPRLELILEELLVNVASYAYSEGGGEVEIACILDNGGAAEAGEICLLLRDWGRPFDPLAAPAPDLGRGIGERTLGGLGVHLVREMADRCAYERRNGANEFRAGILIR